mmetsp:Transcript_29220/g.83710  ORF Transcript_29220/g.83710 Transcript_29220/m.83710 type:complete len:336 (-) Transcript_29220:269-1276(-)
MDCTCCAHCTAPRNATVNSGTSKQRSNLRLQHPLQGRRLPPRGDLLNMLLSFPCGPEGLPLGRRQSVWRQDAKGSDSRGSQAHTGAPARGHARVEPALAGRVGGGQAGRGHEELAAACLLADATPWLPADRHGQPRSSAPALVRRARVPEQQRAPRHRYAPGAGQRLLLQIGSGGAAEVAQLDVVPEWDAGLVHKAAPLPCERVLHQAPIHPILPVAARPYYRGALLGALARPYVEHPLVARVRYPRRRVLVHVEPLQIVCSGLALQNAEVFQSVHAARKVAGTEHAVEATAHPRVKPRLPGSLTLSMQPGVDPPSLVGYLLPWLRTLLRELLPP